MFIFELSFSDMSCLENDTLEIECTVVLSVIHFQVTAVEKINSNCKIRPLLNNLVDS